MIREVMIMVRTERRKNLRPRILKQQTAMGIFKTSATRPMGSPNR